MKKLPVGIQTFKDIINANNLYVDKTKDIYNLVSMNDKTYFFLSRPRRFGKSLLISTLEEIFLGNQKYFKDLYIYDKIEWKKYPVIRIDFNALTYTEGTEGFKRTLTNHIKDTFNKYNIEVKGEDYKELFKNLIIELSNIDKVVILIDEYDKPITEVIEDIELTKTNRSILKSFYETIKSCDEYIKFCFLTGVSKFSKVSVFSSLNNLTDLTLDPRFPTLTGITEEELYRDFDEHIKSLAEKLNKTKEETKQVLKSWYNGYSWNGKDFVYNPFSILNVLSVQQINNYWFKSGTTTFLIKLIKEKNIDVKGLENFVASDEMLDSFEIENIKVESLLFQTGYLTIKSIITEDLGFSKYYLSYPNIEVKESFLNNILRNLSDNRTDSRIVVSELISSIINNDLDNFFDILKYNIFAQIPNEIFMSDKEAYYHTIIYLVLTLIGVRIKAEIQTNLGRIDAVIETNTHIYIFEFKMSSTKKALKQIEDKKYYEQYLLSNKEIVLIGVKFDTKSRNIKNWGLKSIKNNYSIYSL
ncbi:MAG: AAA family ATPase [Candidatus Sericytochromatia bacterium]